MLKIRLRRMGAIRQPHYRIVVTDARSPRDGHFIETLGHYNPLTNPATIQVDVAKYEEWRKKGAQPTEAVVSLVRQFNRTARQLAAAGAEAAAQPATRKTRARATTPAPEAAATAEASEATEATEATTDAPMSEAAAEASRDGGEGSEAITEAAPAEDATTEATEASGETTEA